jgi:enterochelin esterase-like enzyme
MRPVRLVLSMVLFAASTAAKAQRIEVTIPGSAPLNGHLILIIAKSDKAEPRMQLTENYMSAQGFGVDVENGAPGKPIMVDEKTFGAPRHSLADLEPGDYSVQAVFNVYEQFHLSTGKTLWLPPDKGEGQKWNRKPGNLYNTPVKLHIDPRVKTTFRLTLDKTMPEVTGTDQDPAVMAEKSPSAKWLKYMRFKSDKLTKFWGRDTYLGAWILLPDGFEDHPSAKYPLVVYQDHYHATSGPAFSATPNAGGRGGRGGRGGGDNAYRFYQDWVSGRLPRVIMVYVQNANPYYDDSYVVDSANVGPYGSAINEELIPAIETRYRGIGQGWARATYGGSTGGWEAAATQVFYPDMYNGAYAACPDPVDFHAYQNVNLYDYSNAFYLSGDFARIPIAGDRKPDGTVIATMPDEYGFEYVLGTHGRSTEQWDIWQAVFSPAGKDGYPADIIDPMTGAIDKDVLKYWHDHYDLAAILKRDWATLGPKLEGKLHFAVGDGDTYFLNNAVHLLQNQLEATQNPHSDATFQYGPGMPHCYTGGPGEYTMQQNSANWAQRVLPQMTEHMIKTAPQGADTKSWVY